MYVDYSLDNLWSDATELPEYWGAWFVPVGGGHMYKLNPILFYHLGASLSHARGIKAGDRMFKATLWFSDARCWLRSFVEEAGNTPMPRSKETAQGLLQILDSIDSGYVYEADAEREAKVLFTEEHYDAIRDAFVKFKEAFTHECQEADVFAVTPKGIYSTRALIEAGEKKFPPNLLKVMPPNTISDVQEAGKCLAFERPTACAFHICRGTEALMLAYYEVLTGRTWPYPKRDWYSYNTQLAANGAPSTITNRLGEIRQDRNAYAHPDITVPLDEAPVIYELCTGVMFYIAKEIERLEAAKAAASSPPPTP